MIPASLDAISPGSLTKEICAITTVTDALDQVTAGEAEITDGVTLCANREQLRTLRVVAIGRGGQDAAPLFNAHAGNTGLRVMLIPDLQSGENAILIDTTVRHSAWTIVIRAALSRSIGHSLHPPGSIVSNGDVGGGIGVINRRHFTCK